MVVNRPRIVGGATGNNHDPYLGVVCNASGRKVKADLP